MEAGERGGGEMNRLLGPVRKGSARKVSVQEAEPPSAPQVTPRTMLEWPRSSGASGIPVGSVVHPFGGLCAVPRAGTVWGRADGSRHPLGLPACR